MASTATFGIFTIIGCSVPDLTFLSTCTTTAAATGLPLWFVERELSAATPPRKPLGPNDRAAIALIGCGGMGRGDAGNAQRFGDIVSVFDPAIAAGAEIVEVARCERNVVHPFG